MFKVFRDISGMSFNYLTVLHRVENKGRRTAWLCRCKCGVEKVISSENIVSGHTISCGCRSVKNCEETRIKVSVSRKGKNTGKRPKELCEKISESRMGMKFTEEHKQHLSLKRMGKEPWNKGKENVYSFETLRAMSERRMGKPLSVETRLKLSLVHKGEKHWNWNPEKTQTERDNRPRAYTEYRMWRTDVFRRDGFLCQRCHNESPKRLTAHHINSYQDNPSLRTALENGITLCQSCHKEFHHIYGYGNNTSEHFNNFMEIGNGITYLNSIGGA